VAIWSLVHGYISLRIDGNFDDRRDRDSGQPRSEAILALFARWIG